MNYCGFARSNHFLVKDEPAFRTWAADLDLQVNTNSYNAGATKLFSVISLDDGGWPSTRKSCCDSHQDDNVDIPSELAAHLQEGEIAILMEVGHEGDRYYIGTAHAVHSNGSVVSINLDDIYALAGRTFQVPTESITLCQR